MDIFVGNLTPGMEAEHLFSCFSEFGEVADLRIIEGKDWWRDPGFAFVTMPDPLEAREAIMRLDGCSLKGRQLLVQPARKRRR